MRTAIIAVLIVIAGSVSSFAQGGRGELNLNNYTDSVSYLLGMQIAQNLQKDNIRVNIDLLSAGVEDVLNRVQAKLTPTERMNVLLNLQARGVEIEKDGELPPEKFAEKLYGKVSSNPPTKIKSSNDSVSYCIGFNIGEEILGQQVGVNTYALVTAIKMVAANKPLMLSETDILMLRMRLESEAGMERDEFAKNAEQGEAFLKQNRMRDGVVTLPSGLQYEVLSPGQENGPKPTIDNEVTVHYRGMFIDGTTFDSSIERGEPVTFPLSKVIRGWIEALQLMSEGSRWKLFIPEHLAYGSQGAGKRIPPHSTLIFEVELISILR